MKKLVILSVFLSSVLVSIAQDSTRTPLPVDTTTPDRLPPPPVRKWNSVNTGNRSGDHLMFQIGYNGWAQKPDSINTKGLSRSFSVYFMFDFPFKSKPNLSIGVGAGISSNNVYFDKTYIDIAGRNNNQLRFQDRSDTNYFKKFKLMTTYLEAPIELRWMANPYSPNRSWKVAVGAKIGTLLAATTKGKNLLNSSGQNILSYTEKQKAKRFFNGTRLSLTGRAGYGNFGIFASYQVNQFIKEGFGPDIRPYNIGLNISGL